DGTEFKIHTIILQLGSGFFKTMASLPQKSGNNDESATENVVHLDEDKRLLAAAGEKYDMPDVAVFVRNAIMKPGFLGSALEIYVLSCRNGWMEEASMLKLFELHRRRKELVLEAMELEYNTPSLLVQSGQRLSWPALTPAHSLTGCPNIDLDQWYWNALKHFIALEFEKSASGDILRGPLFWNSPQQAPLLGLRCNRCGTPFFKKRGLISEFGRILDNLPQFIELTYPL
ncbi:hypothetical protein DFH11DRAFT_1611504, partial [Phellopilus nigrolimitatus]